MIWYKDWVDNGSLYLVCALYETTDWCLLLLSFPPSPHCSQWQWLRCIAGHNNSLTADSCIRLSFILLYYWLNAFISKPLLSTIPSKQTNSPVSHIHNVQNMLQNVIICNHNVEWPAELFCSLYVVLIIVLYWTFTVRENKVKIWDFCRPRTVEMQKIIGIGFQLISGGMLYVSKCC